MPQSPLSGGGEGGDFHCHLPLSAWKATKAVKSRGKESTEKLIRCFRPAVNSSYGYIMAFLFFFQLYYSHKEQAWVIQLTMVAGLLLPDGGCRRLLNCAPRRGESGNSGQHRQAGAALGRLLHHLSGFPPHHFEGILPSNIWGPTQLVLVVSWKY